MNEIWCEFVIGKVHACVYVLPNTGKRYHPNRPSHGFVINDAGVERDYVFSDGTVMHTPGDSLFYLPKGSTYDVRGSMSGGCYCINFDADIADAPFCLSPRKIDDIRHAFRLAETAWRQNERTASVLAMRAIYDCIYQLMKEESRAYMPGKVQALLSPATEYMKEHFTDNSLTVVELATLCNMSEVYFRRLFLNAYGVSPKEYLIEKRLSYAKTLLLSGTLSVSEVALRCGYGEPCHFSREFLRRVGTTPKDFSSRK